VLDALEEALHDRRPLFRGGLVHHSDTGSQGVLNRSSQHQNFFRIYYRIPSEDQHSQVTLPKKKGDRKLGQLLAGSRHRMMVSTSLWMAARQRASPPPNCLRGPMYAEGGQRSRGGK
jgi:hypothetical protein